MHVPPLPQLSSMNSPIEVKFSLGNPMQGQHHPTPACSSYGTRCNPRTVHTKALHNRNAWSVNASLERIMQVNEYQQRKLLSLVIDVASILPSFMQRELVDRWMPKNWSDCRRLLRLIMMTWCSPRCWATVGGQSEWRCPFETWCVGA